MALPEIPSQSVPARSGHIEIGDDHILSEEAAQTQRFVAPKRHDHFMAILTHYGREHLGAIAVVISNENAQRLPGRFIRTR